MYSYLVLSSVVMLCFFFFKQKTAYEMRISDWSSDVCSSDLSQPFDATEQPAHVRGHVVERRRREVEHVAVELGRAPHRLARVVDDVVEPVAGAGQVLAERLHAGRVAQVEAVDLEPVPPLLEVGLAAVAQRRVTGEAGGDDQRRTDPQQLDAGMVPDLHPTAGQQRNPAAQDGRPGPLGVVELRARRCRTRGVWGQSGSVRGAFGGGR